MVNVKTMVALMVTTPTTPAVARAATPVVLQAAPETALEQEAATETIAEAELNMNTFWAIGLSMKVLHLIKKVNNTRNAQNVEKSF